MTDNKFFSKVKHEFCSFPIICSTNDSATVLFRYFVIVQIVFYFYVHLIIFLKWSSLICQGHDPVPSNFNQVKCPSSTNYILRVSWIKYNNCFWIRIIVSNWQFFIWQFDIWIVALCFYNLCKQMFHKNLFYIHFNFLNKNPHQNYKKKLKFNVNA